MEKEFQQYLGQHLPNISSKSAQSVLDLVRDGATVPFIARYRKEKTGNLDELEIRQVLKLSEVFEEIKKRKAFVIKEIETQGNLTDELKKSILLSNDLAEIEEIYRPYKKKKKTKATLAREAGLEPLADWLWGLGHGTTQDATAIEVKAKQFLNPAAGFVTYELAIKGAQDILIDRLSNNADLRQFVRDHLQEKGKVVSKKTKKFKSNSKYSMYADFADPVKSLQTPKASHRYLALRRGWHEGELTVTIDGDSAFLEGRFVKEACPDLNLPVSPHLIEAAKMALNAHVVPSVVNQIHNRLKELADEQAIDVFSANLRKLLMASPFGNKCVLGVDPGFKSGCKVALIDANGVYISHTIIHTQGDGAEEKAKKLLADVVKQIRIESIAVGNGTGGREAESFFRKVLKDLGVETPVILVNEAGASVYSASEIAREEFPELDVSVRGAISIARRLQDPLAELVKIDPKSIGVGQYQHDVSQTDLKNSLHGIVESCVNQVGVNLNTASAALLGYVAGVGPAIAQNIISFRKTNGAFTERAELNKVPHFSSKTFEQSAGFLRIHGGKISLDNTGIHPERYTVVREMAQDLGLSVSQLISTDGARQLSEKKEKWAPLIGEFTFNDIVSELQKPGRDPRAPFKAISFRDDIHEVKDLKDGMICPGVVTNVTNFGAFVDIGVRQDGLVHISEMSHEFVEDPRKMVSPGDAVQVKVLSVDAEKPQIALTMKLTEKPKPAIRPPREQLRDENGRRPHGDGAPRARGGDRAGGSPREGDRPRNIQKFSGNKRPMGPGGGKGGVRPPPKPKVALNNPFAELAAIRDKLKK